MNEVKDDIKWINENMRGHEEGNWKVENVEEMKFAKREHHKKFTTTNDFLATFRIELGTQ